MRRRSRLVHRAGAGAAAWCVLATMTAAVHAGPPAADEGKVRFNRDIRPILSDKCFACHGPDHEKRKAGLRLDHRDAATAELKSGGRAIVPGKVDESELAARIDAADPEEMMPPASAKKPLGDRDRELLKRWIAQGAEYEPHWSFVAPARPPVPQVADAGWGRNPIDAFVLARLEAEGLKPSPEADPATLLRRVTLDLTGLPPTPQEVDAFLADASPEAYDKAVERLLVSPRHAERLAMSWLDAARYADTNGYNNDEDRSQWPWRDWVIDAFRANMPFDRFLTEQVAGDLMPGPTIAQRVATAFFRNQVHNTEGGIIPEEYQAEYVADRVHTAATVFLGLSMQCARCHDHKFDPITQREYYEFAAFLNNIADKPASYVNFVAAEPYIRVPSPEQAARREALTARRGELTRLIEGAEAGADAALQAWAKGRTPEELRAQAGAGLVARLAFDETSGDAVHDAAGMARRGTVRGKAAWGEGKVGGALEFDGSTYVDCEQLVAFEADAPFSISAHAFPTSNEAVAILSKMDDAGANRGFDVLIEEGKVACHIIAHWPDDAIKVRTKAAMPPNAWHHVLVTYDGSRKAAGVRLYVDGKPQELDVPNDALKGSIRTDKPLHVGKRQTGLPFRGKIDDVQLYDEELDPADAPRLAAGETASGLAELFARAPEACTPAQQARLRRYYLQRIDPDHRRLQAERAEAAKQAEELEKAMPAVMVMQELAEPRANFLLKRGQYDQPGEKVEPGVPAALPPLPAGAPRNRLGLARWLVDPRNPLTARVAVNRWWQLYFGTGLVKTVEDFGVQGEWPSHPELLDYLATEFVRTGWDVRALQRLIVTSAAYRQSSRITPELRERDPENRLLARGPRFRLPAELVRDNALAAAGLLHEKAGGPSVKPYQPPGLWEEVSVEHKAKYVPDRGEGLYRRSMYTFWKRTCPPPSLMSFDAPNRETCVARRATTNTPLQALILLNDPTYVEAARKLAERVLREGGPTPEGRLDRAFRLVLARPAGAEERAVLIPLFEDALTRFRADGAAAEAILTVGDAPRDPALDKAELAAWAAVASTILNLDETITRR